MNLFRAGRCQGDFTLYVHEDIAKIVKKHDVWDMIYDEETRIILISPGLHASVVGGGHIRYSGCSTVELQTAAAGFKQGIRFGGFNQYSPCPMFGTMDVIVDFDDDESMRTTLPPTHNLPWLSKFRPAAWTEQNVIDYIQTRVDSALAAGFSLTEAIKLIKIPEIMTDYIGVEGWKKVLSKYQ